MLMPPNSAVEADEPPFAGPALKRLVNFQASRRHAGCKGGDSSTSTFASSRRAATASGSRRRPAA